MKNHMEGRDTQILACLKKDKKICVKNWIDMPLFTTIDISMFYRLSSVYDLQIST